MHGHRIDGDAFLQVGAGLDLVAGAGGAAVGGEFVEVAVGFEEGGHAVAVFGREGVVEAAAVDGFAEEFADVASRVGHGLAEAEGFAAVGGWGLEVGAAAAVDFGFQCHAEGAAVAEHGLVVAGQAGGAGVEIFAVREVADLLGAVGHVDAGAAADAPVAAADAVARFDEGDAVAGLAEFPGGDEAGDAGAEHDDAGPFGRAGELQGRAIGVFGHHAERAHGGECGAETTGGRNAFNELAACGQEDPPILLGGSLQKRCQPPDHGVTLRFGAVKRGGICPGRGHALVPVADYCVIAHLSGGYGTFRVT